MVVGVEGGLVVVGVGVEDSVVKVVVVSSVLVIVVSVVV